jgi:hypothetical protein
LALTRPKSPSSTKKDDINSSPNSTRPPIDQLIRSPVRERENSISRPSSKTPANASSTSEHQNSSLEITTANSNANSNSKISTSPLSMNEKSNNQNDSNGINNNNNNHSQQFSSHAMNGPEKILPSPSTDRKDFDFSKVNGKSSY